MPSHVNKRPCRRCGLVRHVYSVNSPPSLCRECAKLQTMENNIAAHALPPGEWRLDPTTRVVRYVPDMAPEPDRPPPREAAVCGTTSGYNAHHRAGEPACDDCRKAKAAHEYRRYWAGRDTA